MSKHYAIFSLGFILFSGLTFPTQAGDLTVSVTGVKDSAGDVGCALYNKEAGFGKRTSAVAVTGQKANAAGNTCVFKGLTTGTYAVAVLHDTNGNQKMDFSALGFPAEDWGMSNNVRPSLRAPTFKEASVAIGDAPLAITVSLAH